MRLASVTIYKKIRLLGLVGCCLITFAKAQTLNSPYSRYGLGDIVPGQNVLNRGMGGLSAGYSDIRSINFANPASYSRLVTTTLDIGVDLESRTIRAVNPVRKYNAADPNISYLQLGVPLKKPNGGIALVFGLRPVTNIDYKISRNERLPNVDSVQSLFEGTGGSYKVNSGLAFRIKGLSVGVNAGYFFGSKNFSTRRLFLNDTVLYYKSNHQTKSNFGGFFLDGGIQYQINFGKNYLLRLGATGNLNTNVSGTKDVVRETFEYTSTGTTRIDSVFEDKNVKGTVEMPTSYTVGFVFNRVDRWQFGFDYVNTKWSEYRYFGETDLVNDSWELRGGTQIQFKPAKSYWSYAAYRAGFSVGKDYINADGTQLNKWSASFGIAFPMRQVAYTYQSSIINTSIEFGQRGNKENLVREGFFRISVGLSLSDIWFNKRKYD